MSVATKRAQQEAIERHRRLHNAEVAKEEARVVEQYLDDIVAYVAKAAK